MYKGGGGGGMLGTVVRFREKCVLVRDFYVLVRSVFW